MHKLANLYMHRETNISIYTCHISIYRVCVYINRSNHIIFDAHNLNIHKYIVYMYIQ